MILTQVCEGCGEPFITRHGLFCEDCAVVRIPITKMPVILKQSNERNRESKLREKRKRQRKQTPKENA